MIFALVRFSATDAPMSPAALLKRTVARLPRQWQIGLKRRWYARQIRRNSFATDEPEYARLAEWVHPGDWVLDVGANVGHYTKRLSELAGADGRVVALEPTPATFSLLAANVTCFLHANVTLLNAAASDVCHPVRLSVPKFESGLDNFYEARLDPSNGTLPVLAIALDALPFPHRISLVKIDAEGHELSVLKGMKNLLARDHPVLIVETGSNEVVQWLRALGYGHTALPGSPNLVFSTSLKGRDGDEQQ